MISQCYALSSLPSLRIYVNLAGGPCFHFTMGSFGIYIFPRALTSPKPIATNAKPYCTLFQNHIYNASRGVPCGFILQFSVSASRGGTYDSAIIMFQYHVYHCRCLSLLAMQLRGA